jgi:hypothetical protein
MSPAPAITWVPTRRVRALVVALALTAASSEAAVARYDVSATTLVTVRSPLPGDTARLLTMDLQIDPAAQGGLAWSTASLVLRYAPQLIIREPQLAPRFLPLHQGFLAFEKRFARASLLLRQEGGYGVADIGSLRLPAGAQPTGVYEVQTLGAVDYVRSASSVNLELRPIDRLTISLSGAYLLSGDPKGGLQLPLQQGPVGNAIVRIVASRRLRLITNARGTHASFITGAEQSIMIFTQAVEWQAERSTVLTVGGGAAVTRERVVELPLGPPPGFHLEVLPAARATLSMTRELQGVPLQLNADVNLLPFADRFTGLVYERLEGRVAATARPTGKLTVLASAGAGYAIPLGRAPQAGDTALFGEVSGAYAVFPWLSLLGTGRAVWTSQPRLGAPPQTLWAVTFGASVRDQDSAAW